MRGFDHQGRIFYYMCFLASRTLVCFLLLMGAATTAWGQSMEFHKIIDTQTPLPGGPNEWNSFGLPSLHQGRVAFQGFERGGAALSYMLIAAADGGPVTKLLDSSATLPHNGLPFQHFWNPSLRGDTLLFGGSSHHQWDEGIYTLPAAGGPLSVWLDPSIAAGPYHFAVWDGSWAAYAEGDSSSPYAIYATQGGSKGSLVAGAGAATPSGGTFWQFDPPAIEAGALVFPAEVNRGALGLDSGIYHWDTTQQQLEIVADFNTEIPGGSGTFEGLRDCDTDGSEVSFLGIEGFPGFGGQLGVYTGPLTGPFTRVADLTTPIPGSADLFTMLGDSAVEDGLVVFHGGDYTTNGLYGQVRGGPAFKIVEGGEIWNGKTLSFALISPESLHHSQLACLFSFTDFSRAVYTIRLFTLRVDGRLQRGAIGLVRAAGVRAGERVSFTASLDGLGPGPCPPPLGGLCLDLINPLLLGSTLADADGVAEFSKMVPASLPPIPVHLQAVVARGAGGMESIKSNTVSAPLF